MLSYTPVDHDPFKKQGETSFIPVDHDPFTEPVATTPAAESPPPEKRSAMGELWSQFKAGAFSDLPRMAGKAMQYTSSPGNSLYETGKGLVEDAAAIASLPEMQPGDTTGRPIVDALSKGARMIPQSIAPAVGAGLVLSGAGAPAGVALIGGSALAAAPAGMAQAQETLEKGLAKHGLTPEQAGAIPDDPRVQEATNAARLTGGIEFGGELAGSALAGRFMGIGGSMAKSVIGKALNQGERSAAQSVLKSFTNPATAARFGLNALETAAGETAVEMGQNAGEAAVEQHYNYDQKAPWQAAKESIAPTLGMSALLLPLGIPAHASNAVKVKAVTIALQNPNNAPEIRTQAADIIYNELAKNSPDAAANFAAHSFDAIHGDQDTGSAPYELNLDDTVLQPLTPRALQQKQQQPEPTGPLSRAVSAGTQAPEENKPQPVAPTYGGTDLLKEDPTAFQAVQPSTIIGANGQPELTTDQNTGIADIPFNIQPAGQSLSQIEAQPVIQEATPTETAAFSAPSQTLVIPADSLHGTLRHFIKSGQEKTGQSGKTVQSWDKPNKHYLDKAVTDYLLPAVEQGIASRDTEGAYTVDTDLGKLRIFPPNEAKGNYRLEYHATPPISESFIQPTPVISRQAIEAAFPGQSVTQDTEGHTVALKNGATIKIATTGEIRFNAEAAKAAHGRQFSPAEKPVASFQQLDRHAVIALTDKGAGEIHHETFHAAMAIALNENQRAAILKKFGTEETAAAEYQQLKDSGKFEQKAGHQYLNIIHRFFSKIRTLFDQTHGIMSDVATGKVWESRGEAPATSGPSSPSVKYSFGEINTKTKAVKDKLTAMASRSTFVRQDMAPAMQAAGEGLTAAWDGIKAAVNPMDRTPEADEAGRILIEGMGRMEHGKERFITSLNKATLQSTQTGTKLTRALDLLKTSTTLADKLFTSMPENERIEFMQRMDTGQKQATKDLQQVADAIKAMFEEKAKAVQALGTGALETIRENYFPHAWQRPEEAGREIATRLSKRPLEGSKAFSKARVFEDINAGIEAGFKLVDTNPINLAFIKMAEMDKYINAHVALQAMEASGLVELIPAGEKMPEGFSDISGKYGMVTKRSHQDSATGLPGELKSYRYIAREDVAQVFNNYLSQSLYNNKYLGKPFSAYMKAANTLNQFQLGVFSAFHAGFTSLEAVISHAALGIKALTRGDLQEAGKYFKHAPAAWYLNPKLGDKVIKAWMGDESAAREMPQIILWLEMAGARRVMDTRFQTDQTQKMFQAWSEGNKIGAGLRSIPTIVEQSARPILEWLVPRQKFGVFAEMANDWNQRNPYASHEATRKAIQQIWNRVDSRLGQVVYDRLFVHNIAKNLTQALLRAPGWTGGTILEVGGGIKDLATYAKDLATKGKQAELSDRAAYTLSLLVITAVSNAVLTAAFTGEPPQDWKDLLAFRTGKKDEKGNPERFMLPTYAKDLYAYAQKPGTTLLHKTHPLISLIGDLAANKDYYGTEIRHEGDNPIIQVMQAGKFTAKAFVPFWMKGAAKEFERGGSIGSMAAPLIGIMPAPADLNKTEAERLASQFVSARMPKGTKTQEQFERSQLVQHLTGLARRDKTQAHQEVREALKDKKITMLQARHVFQNAGLAPIQIAFKRLSFEEAEQVFEVATDEEKKKLRFMLMQKRNRHLKAA